MEKPNDLDTRIKTWFALFPVIIDNECRWLETVTVKQIYLLGWDNIEFIDNINDQLVRKERK